MLGIGFNFIQKCAKILRAQVLPFFCLVEFIEMTDLTDLFLFVPDGT